MASIAHAKVWYYEVCQKISEQTLPTQQVLAYVKQKLKGSYMFGRNDYIEKFDIVIVIES